jgi:hypothetical protein
VSVPSCETQYPDTAVLHGGAEGESTTKSALAGLSFPCLAGSEVCPEYVIVE